jgi:hypothetical protein
MSQKAEEESTMANQAQVPVPAQGFIPRDYQILAGLDVDKHSIAATFCNHEKWPRWASNSR